MLEVINTATNIFMVSSLYIKHDLWLQWSISISKFSKYDTLINTGGWQSLIIEIIISLISPIHQLEDYWYEEWNDKYQFLIRYKINDILLAISFIRIYHPIKFILYSTEFMNPRSQRICDQYGCDATPMFAIKCLAKSNPFTSLGISMIVTTFIFGFQLRIFEMPLDDVTGFNFKYLQTCYWNVIITLATVGYGEVYAESFFGRLVAIMISFWGIFYVSVLVVAVTE